MDSQRKDFGFIGKCLRALDSDESGNWRFFPLLFFAVYYLVFMIPVLRSGYMYDDIWTYTSKGWAILHDTNLWGMTLHEVETWYKELGRTFIFSWYGIIVISVLGQRTYKLCYVILTFLDGVVFGKVAEKMSGDHRLKNWVMAVFPVVVSLNCSWFNALYGFTFLLQIVFLWSFLSVYCFQKYLDRGKVWYQVLSCIILSLALGTYEVSYVLCLWFALVSFNSERKFLPALRRIIPQIITGIAWIVFTAYARTHATGLYVGTSINLGVEVAGGFMKQYSGISDSINNVIFLPKLSGNIGGLIAAYGVRYLIVVALTFFGVLICIKPYGFESAGIAGKGGSSEHERIPYAFILAGALWTIAGPTFLMAISERYQKEVNWGRAYLPAYISVWGVTLFIALLCAELGKEFGKFPRLRRKVVLGLTVAALCLVVPDQMIGDMTVDEVGNWHVVRDRLFEDAGEAGIFDDWKENELILDGDGFWYRVDQHYVYLLGYKVRACSCEEMYGVNDEGFETTGLLSEFNERGFFRCVCMPGQCRALVMADCNSLDAVPDSDEGASVVAWSENLKIYVPTESGLSAIVVTYEDGRQDSISLNTGNLVSENDKGRIYRLETPEPVNVRTVDVQ